MHAFFRDIIRLRKAEYHSQKGFSGEGGREMDVRPGDILLMKKPHPCGSKTFLVLRSGMDFKIRCTSCGHEIMLPRLKCEKNIKKILREEKES